MSRLFIFCGEYGSGKTQVAVNYSKYLAKKHKRAKLVDLDIVNPFFRSRDSLKELKESQVDVIFNKEYGEADLPALPPEVISSFVTEEPVVFDVGGDDGAVVLGRYYYKITQTDHEFWMVVNTNRPYTSTVEGIRTIKERIEKKSRLKITGLINNSNLGELTEVEHILEGEELVLKAAQELKLKTIFTAVKTELVDDVKDKLKTEIFPVQLDYKLPWL
ncbi:ATP-binding protein [Alkalicella caledoniensis]|uniref:ATP-binding protein n=1 Tax=Alkalicella caledoniensis TaxID=2731377 RepID=A0A7G9WBW9_ALKCA|nr:ATP-binding protein [Alkalicella caledoniensis]QNO16181.1 ATP-binding protein [Alkalicella caledoniensis]